MKCGKCGYKVKERNAQFCPLCGAAITPDVAPERGNKKAAAIIIAAAAVVLFGVAAVMLLNLGKSLINRETKIYTW